MKIEKTAGGRGDQRLKPTTQAHPHAGRYNTIGFNFLQELIQISALNQKLSKMDMELGADPGDSLWPGGR